MSIKEKKAKSEVGLAVAIVAAMMMSLGLACGEEEALPGAFAEESHTRALAIAEGDEATAADLMLALVAVADLSGADLAELFRHGEVELGPLHGPDDEAPPDDCARMVEKGGVFSSPSPDPAPESESSSSGKDSSCGCEGAFRDSLWTGGRSVSVQGALAGARSSTSPDPAPEGPDQGSDD